VAVTAALLVELTPTVFQPLSSDSLDALSCKVDASDLICE
jgi:hypothetical protein